MELILWYIWVGGGHLAATIICIWAFRKGGDTERVGAAIIGLAWLLTIIVSQANQGPKQWVMLIDAMTCLGLIYLALTHRKVWTFFASAVMVNTLAGHLVNDLTSHTIRTYATANALWSGWFLLLCLGYGVYSHEKYLRKSLQPSLKPAP